MIVRRQIEEIERQRGSQVLVFAASHLDIELLPALFDLLRQAGSTERLDILIYCRGGVVTAARRIALLLNEFTDHLAFIVPDHCESSGTIMALAGEEIIAGPAAIFSPIDPLLQGSPSSPDSGGDAISSEDVRLFRKMSEDWFGLEENEARAHALSILCENVFPTTLTSFYRARLEVETICSELLSLHMGSASAEAKTKIISCLLSGYHSHGFPLSRQDLRELGLPLHDDPIVEDCAWEIARELRKTIGGGVRKTAGDDWFDALLANGQRAMRRRKGAELLMPTWEEFEIE